MSCGIEDIAGKLCVNRWKLAVVTGAVALASTCSTSVGRSENGLIEIYAANLSMRDDERETLRASSRSSFGEQRMIKRSRVVLPAIEGSARRRDLGGLKSPTGPGIEVETSFLRESVARIGRRPPMIIPKQVTPSKLRQAAAKSPLQLIPALRDRLEAALEIRLEDLRLVESSIPFRLRANAIACGETIFFASGSLDWRTAKGRRLFGHELAHIRQQQNMPAPAALSICDDRLLEQEANDWVAALKPCYLSTAPPRWLQRAVLRPCPTFCNAQHGHFCNAVCGWVAQLGVQ